MARKILVVDDDLLTLKNVSQFLREEGYRVDEACDGDEALEKLRANGYDLVLSDIVMPRTDGFRLIERSRSVPQPPPVVLMSAHPTVDPRSVTSLGAEDFVSKPFLLEDVLRKIERVLAHSPSIH